MNLREILKSLKNVTQMVRIFDDYSFVCDICGADSEQNLELLKEYLDRTVRCIDTDYVKSSDGEIEIYLNVRLDEYVEEKKPEVDDGSYVKIEMSEEIDILPCTCGGGRPLYKHIPYYYEHIFTCEKCHRYAGSDNSMTEAATRWNLWHGGDEYVEQKEEKKPNDEPNAKIEEGEIDILPL
mgnify:CR=1 FL=1